MQSDRSSRCLSLAGAVRPNCLEHKALVRKWAAVIAAGGQAPIALQKVTGVPSKAEVLFGGVPSGVRVARSAEEAGCTPVVVSCDSRIRTLPWPAECKFADAGETNIATVANGINALDDTDAILVMPSDLPLVSVEAICGFLEGCESRIVDSQEFLCVGLSRISAIERTHPSAKVSYLRLREGRFASGGFYAMSKSAFQRAHRLLEDASRNRKSQLKLALQFGVLNAIRYFSGQMSIPEAEKLAGRVFGAECFIVEDCHPDMVMDFDDAIDYEYLLRITEEK